MKRDFSNEIEKKVQRMLKARQREEHPLAFGLTMMGTVGWTIVIPVLIGAWVGRLLDERLTQSVSWTVTLIVGGLFVGGYTAWRWGKRMLEENDDQQEERE